MGGGLLALSGTIYIPTVDDVDFYMRVSSGDAQGFSVVHKFGQANVPSSLTPIALGGFYQTPQASGAQQLRIRSGGDANNTSSGSGAREITLIGLDSGGQILTGTLTPNGVSAGAFGAESFFRLFRFYVSSSGTYATQAASSHSGNDIVIEDASGNEWGRIGSNGLGKGQSEVGVYSVPAGYEAYLKSVFVQVDSNKAAEVTAFHRPNILQESPPYDAMRMVGEFIGVSGSLNITPSAPLGPYAELSDIGFMGKSSTGTANISVDFELILKSI